MRPGALYASMADQKGHPSPFTSCHGEWGPHLLGARLKVEGKEALSWGESRGKGAGRRPRGRPFLRPHSGQHAGDIYQPSAPRDPANAFGIPQGKLPPVQVRGTGDCPPTFLQQSPVHRVALRSNSDQIWGTQGLAAHLTVSLSPFFSASQACMCV